MKLCMTDIKWLTYANGDFQNEENSNFFASLEGLPGQLIIP